MTSVVAVVALAGRSEDGDEVEEDDWMDLARARGDGGARGAASRMTKDSIFSKSSDGKENDADAREEAATRAATRGSMRDGYAACGMRARCGDGGRSDVRWETFASAAAACALDASAKSESAKMTVTRGAEEAAALACETLNSVSSSASASASARAVVDVVWFVVGRARRVERRRDAIRRRGEWTPAMVAAYGVFRRAKSLFGEFARARVVSCGRGRVSRGARAVAEAAACR